MERLVKLPENNSPAAAHAHAGLALNLSGPVAQYGRGAGMIAELADRLVGQFADSLHEKIAAAGRPSAPGVPEETPTPAAPPVPGFRLLAGSAWSALIRGLARLFRRTRT